MHHMDVVPTDASRWKRPPFGAEIAEGVVWGRGAFDMKGPGVAHLYAFLALKRLKVPLDRDVLLMASPDEEIGGRMGAEWMRKTHFADLDPEYILDEGGFGSREVFSPDKLVFGISVAEKKLFWLKLTAEGVAGHGSQPNDQNPNDRLTRALARLLAEPLPTSGFSVLTTFKSNVSGARAEQVHQRDPALDDCDHEPALGSRRSAQGQRHPVDCRGHAGLPRPPGHDDGAVDGRDPPPPGRSRDQD